MLVPHWYEVGRTDTPAKGFTLAVFLPNKGHLTFWMKRQIAEQLYESLGQALEGSDEKTSAPPRDLQ
jgi:hypothetical protein